jgi:tRNA A-37 threonylcarbamoyl transferase component Bud32
VGRAEIGPYRILRLLQEGGGGRVYVALDQRLNRRVALKFISVPRDQEARQLVIAEARALAKLNHRCIVQIFDVVEVSAYIILVMEYVPGTDLADLLERTQLDLLSVLQLALDLGAALATAHHSGIVHRDLKPENVLLAPTGHIKLTDFGIASAQSTEVENEGQRNHVVAGSYSSMSPEHVRGEAVDQRSDLFALGVLIYRLVAGRHPFVDHDNQQIAVEDVLLKTHTSLCQSDNTTSARLSELVDELLQKDPRNRPKSALGVRQEVLAVLRELPLTRGKPLARFMVGVARAEDAIETVVDLPAGVGRGARSHLLSSGEWGPWARSSFSDWQRPLQLFMATGVLILAIFGAEKWLQSDVVEVSVRRPQVMLDSSGLLAPNANQLKELLERAIAWQGNVLLSSAPAKEVLDLQVNCNEHICGLLLRRESANQTISSYTTLLPGAPHAAWQASIEKALKYLFEQHESWTPGQ